MAPVGLSLISVLSLIALLIQSVKAPPPPQSSTNSRGTPLGGILSDVAFSGNFANLHSIAANAQPQSESLRSVPGGPQIVSQQSLQVPVNSNHQLSVVQKQGLSNQNQISLTQSVGFNGPLEPVAHGGQTEVVQPAATVLPASTGSPLVAGQPTNGQTGAAGQISQSGVASQTGQLGAAGQTGQLGAAGQTGQLGAAGQTGPSGSAGQTGQLGAAGQTAQPAPSGQTGTAGQLASSQGQNGQQPIQSGGQTPTGAGLQQPTGTVAGTGQNPTGVQNPTGQQPNGQQQPTGTAAADPVGSNQNAGVIQPAQKQSKDSDRPTADFTCYLIPQKTVKKTRRSLSQAYLHLTGGQL